MLSPSKVDRENGEIIGVSLISTPEALGPAGLSLWSESQFRKVTNYWILPKPRPLFAVQFGLVSSRCICRFNFFCPTRLILTVRNENKMGEGGDG